MKARKSPRRLAPQQPKWTLPEVNYPERKPEKRTGPSRRTQSQRDAINKRAKAWKRPARKTKPKRGSKR
jgi:hypothetical protein